MTHAAQSASLLSQHPDSRWPSALLSAGPSTMTDGGHEFIYQASFPSPYNRAGGFLHHNSLPHHGYRQPVYAYNGYGESEPQGLLPFGPCRFGDPTSTSVTVAQRESSSTLTPPSTSSSPVNDLKVQFAGTAEGDPSADETAANDLQRKKHLEAVLWMRNKLASMEDSTGAPTVMAAAAAAGAITATAAERYYCGRSDKSSGLEGNTVTAEDEVKMKTSYEDRSQQADGGVQRFDDRLLKYTQEALLGLRCDAHCKESINVNFSGNGFYCHQDRGPLSSRTNSTDQSRASYDESSRKLENDVSTATTAADITVITGENEFVARLPTTDAAWSVFNRTDKSDRGSNSSDGMQGSCIAKTAGAIQEAAMQIQPSNSTDGESTSKYRQHPSPCASTAPNHFLSSTSVSDQSPYRAGVLQQNQDGPYETAQAYHLNSSAIGYGGLPPRTNFIGEPTCTHSHQAYDQAQGRQQREDCVSPPRRDNGDIFSDCSAAYHSAAAMAAAAVVAQAAVDNATACSNSKPSESIYEGSTAPIRAVNGLASSRISKNKKLSIAGTTPIGR
ncbi:unnamed protein product [Schistocephalus solidus]|uniref:Uncharacterized protein n=1 Tax=Schistocephalus solidus TaxID=70667 RepID=A0A183TTI8_SCHSO|nr:unnamed protein product [Schistocephalus solidus]